MNVLFENPIDENQRVATVDNLKQFLYECYMSVPATSDSSSSVRAASLLVTKFSDLAKW